MRNPLFSIILTTYNRSHFLRRAIHSTLQQTFTDFELLIIDDYSTDNTKQVVAEFTDKRMAYIKQTHNQGVSNARNLGIERSKGEYICFLDDDDEFLPEFLETIYNFLEKRKQPFIGFIRVGIINVTENNELFNQREEKINTQIWHLKPKKNLLFITKMAYTALVYHSLCFTRAGTFNPKLKFAEDLDLILRMLAAKLDYASIAKILVKVHIHKSSSLSRSISNTARINTTNYFLFLQDSFLNKHKPLWLYYYTSYARDYYRLGEKHLARRLVKSILKKCWYHPKLWEMFLKFELRELKSGLLKRIYPT